MFNAKRLYGEAAIPMPTGFLRGLGVVWIGCLLFWSSPMVGLADEDELGKLFDLHQWTEYHVIAIGNRITIRVNGHLMSEILDDAPEARRSGVIAFQLHRGTPMKIRFADVQLKIVNGGGGIGQTVLYRGL